MRVDTGVFATKNASTTKEVRLVVEVAFDPANTILRYFTSHVDSALPSAATVVLGVVQKTFVTSQQLNPDTAVATIGSMSFDLVDKGGAVTAALGGQIALGRSTRQQRVRFYVGYAGDAWADYTLAQTQLVRSITFDHGAYHFACADLQRTLRKDILDHAKTNLAATLGASRLSGPCLAGATTLDLVDASAFFTTGGSGVIRDGDANDLDTFTWTGKTGNQLTGVAGLLAHGAGARGLDAVSVCDAVVQVYDTSDFAMVAHGTSYQDAPSATVGYAKIDQEVFRYTGTTPTSFTGVVRGALLTIPTQHAVDQTLAQERRPVVEEQPYLEMPVPKLMYALLTGVLYNQAGATLPPSWHLGIDPSYVRLADFTSNVDLWDPTDDQKGLIARFDSLAKIDGKKFIETELLLLCGAFSPIYSSGEIGFRRASNILAGAAYVRMLDESNLTSWGPLVHDFDSIHNIVRIDWNWDNVAGQFTRINEYVDASSISIYGRSDPLNLAFKGLHGSRATNVTLGTLFNALRDRYTGPPLRLKVEGLHRLNTLEVGDVVRVRLANVRDYLTPGGGGPIDRSFEIQQISVDWKGTVSAELFASSQAPDALAPVDNTLVLPDSWYTSAGTAMLTTGSAPKHISSDVTLVGSTDMTAPASIFYCDGDLQIDSGVTVTVQGNVQLRVKGFLQVNGRIDGKGKGIAGAAALASGAIVANTSYNPGTPGYLGSTEAGGGLSMHNWSVFGWTLFYINSWRGGAVLGKNAAAPSLNLSWNGTTLAGIPADHRGTSGSSGMPYIREVDGFRVAGSAGGASGAGLLLVSRGVDIGIAASVDLSGADGVAGALTDVIGSGPGDTNTFRTGSGAGGAPGAFTIVLDGANQNATGLSETSFIARNGSTPIPDTPAPAPTDYHSTGTGFWYSYFVGTGDGSTFELPTLSGSRGAMRIQHAPANLLAGQDPTPVIATKITPPSALTLSSGTSELLKQSDGTIVPRIKATWIPSTDPRTVGYELQVKESTQPDTEYHSTEVVLGRSSAVAWMTPVRDGVSHDVRIHAAGANRDVSDWVVAANHVVIGKTAPPADVGVLTYVGTLLTWAKNTEADFAGYRVRYQPNWSSTDWASALVPIGAGSQGFITPTEFNTDQMIGAQVTMLLKCIDTSGNESLNVATKQIDLRPDVPTAFTVSRQPDGTREFGWVAADPVRIRYQLGTATDWTTMFPLHTGLLLASPFESNQLAAGTYTFAIKTVDSVGNESATALFIINVTLGDPRIAGSIEDFQEEPTWTETKTSCHLDGATFWLVADSLGTWATSPTWAAMGAWVQAAASPMQYERKIDTGNLNVFTPLVSVVADSTGGSLVVEEAHSNVDSGYTAFAPIGAELTCRWVRIRVTVTGSFPKLKSMRTILSAAPIEEEITDLLTSTLTGAHRIGVGDVRLPITKVYNVIRKVDVTLQSVGPGWSWVLMDKNVTSGPRIQLYNGSNALADALIDATVKGV